MKIGGKEIMNNFREVYIGQITVYISYSTVVGFEYRGKSTVRENIWGTTSGKHLNYIDNGDYNNRVDFNKFERLLAEAMFENAKNILEEVTYSIEDYMQIAGIKCTYSIKNLDELRDYLDNNNHQDLWDYPLEELDHCKEQNIPFVRVKANGEVRLFETDKEVLV